jgi:hypothetical protein
MPRLKRALPARYDVHFERRKGEEEKNLFLDGSLLSSFCAARIGA